MLSTPAPNPSARNNSVTLPITFIWFLNQFTKAVMDNFIGSVFANNSLSDHIGLMVLKIFSDVQLKWRGASMIDIFMARMRKRAPILFGFRGNDYMEGGRAAIGWKKYNETGNWDDELTHFNRMIGLSRGYAAISLRDFGRRLDNPWAPWHYWQTLASILSTPTEQRTRTQYTIVAALIDGHEGKFVAFYGNAAMALLRYAVVEFPKNPKPENQTYAAALATVGSSWEKDFGFELEPRRM